MKTYILLTIICAINLSSFAQKKPKIKGDKHVENVSYEILSGFNAIEVDDALEVKINQSEEDSYTINADLNLHTILQFTVHDSVLKIYSSHNITRFKKLEIWLNYTNIEYITLKNDAKIESENVIDCNKMQINAYQSSKFDLDVKTKELEVNVFNNAGGKISSRANKTSILMKDRTDLKASISTNETILTLTESAQLTLTGDSDHATYIIKDNAEINASIIKNESVKLTASDNAKSYIYTSKNLSLYAKGNAAIYLYGNPEIVLEGFKDKVQLIKK